MISNLPHDTNVPPEDGSSFSHLLHYELRCTDLIQISDINLMIISVTMGPIDSILGFYLHAYLHLTFTKNFDLSIF